MIIVKLHGGLGNQMFQYAFGLALSQKLKAPVYFDTSFFHQIDHGLTPRSYELSVFGEIVKVADSGTVKEFLNPAFVRRLLNKAGINKHGIYNEKGLCFDEEVFQLKPPFYADGFWQTERFFFEIIDKVLQAFTFKYPLNLLSQKTADELGCQTNSVSVHVRRGENVDSKTANEFHGLCSVNYYQNAISIIKGKLTNPRFYFFSDDPEWVEQHLLQPAGDAILIRHNQKDDNWQDMALMSKCSHHIIANSTFSWWAAWLNRSAEKIVIAPARWFAAAEAFNLNTRDLIPANWIQIPND